MEERKAVLQNLYGRKKKIAIISINGNPMAKAIVKALKDEGFLKVYEFESLRSYPAYYALQEFKPEYTMIIDEPSHKCKIKSCVIDDETGLHRKARENSNFARDFFYHPLMMINVVPEYKGVKKISYDDVKRMDWFLKDDSPFLNLELPQKSGVPEAIVAGVKEYFISKGKVIPKEEKKECPNCLYGSVSR